MEKNLTKAVESLTVESSMTNSMTSPHPKRSCTEERSSRPQIFRSMSMSSEMSETTTASEAWMECFYEKEMGRFSRPRPLSRRLVTSDDHYKQLSKMIVPGEKSLATAIRRFPLPASITGGNLLLKSQTSWKSLATAIRRFPLPASITGGNLLLKSQTSCPTASSLGLEKPTTVPSSALVDSKHLTHHFDRDSSYSTIDSETRTGPPQPETSSPVSVTRFLGDN
eukprot:CAMPEP_0184476036 /NCGR_PEP_ID=MMETSP0740-20130409/146880_1 /TAXON_ID=385413 /ORGANISM="Thalassiosira miniscula, Strain CCMP1093" /LENGTH=223 /DNA_ID=CAMNT_0026853587 /DNA_START=15 /DNA_END=686 /DNA_ORIENTATION=+